MLADVNLDQRLSKEEYQQRWPALRRRLFELQHALWNAGIPSMIVIEGWETAGKGSLIGQITQRLDPRGFKLHAITTPRTYEQHMPWLWRFWRRVPGYGEMAIFDRSWYRRVLDDRVEKEVPKKVWQAAFQDIVEFERALAEDGYVVVKFFLQISKKEQRRRLKKLADDPLRPLETQPEGPHQQRRYEEYQAAAEEMLAKTHADWAPWVIVPATDKYWTRVQVAEELINTLEQALGQKDLLALGQATASGFAAAAAPDNGQPQSTPKAQEA